MSKEKELSQENETENTEETDVSEKTDTVEEKDAETSIDIKSTPEYRELNDRYIRLIAEFDNFKKRSAKEYNRLIETAESSLILDLLQVMDDFTRALNHDTEDVENYKQGIEMINTKLTDTLKRRGLQHMRVIDEEFDPNFHEAVMQMEVEDKDDGIIIEEVQAGYYLNDKVLRPAKVVVAKKKEPESGEDEQSDD